MHKTRTKKPFICIFLTVFIISSVLTAYHFRYLKTSFKIDSDRNAIKIHPSNFTHTLKDSILDENTYVENGILQNSGYTISFDIKTSAENAFFFNTSSSAGGGSIYWTVYLIDGNIQTSRLNSISAVLIDKKISDNQWHHILISVGADQKIFIDGKLESRATFSSLYLHDLWFNFYVEPNRDNPNQIYLRNIIFINKSASLAEIRSFNNYFKGGQNYIGLYIQIFIFWIFVFAATVCVILGIILLIRKSYSNEDIPLIVQRVSFVLPLYVLSAFFWSTQFRYKILLLSSLISLYFLGRYYKKILPAFLRPLILTPVSFFDVSFKLILAKDKKRLYRHLFKNEPYVYFLLLIFLSFFLIY